MRCPYEPAFNFVEPALQQQWIEGRQIFILEDSSVALSGYIRCIVSTVLMLVTVAKFVEYCPHLLAQIVDVSTNENFLAVDVDVSQDWIIVMNRSVRILANEVQFDVAQSKDRTENIYASE